MGVPRFEIGIADRPVGAVAVLGVGANGEVAPAVGLARPHQRFSAELVAAYPAERTAFRRAVGHVAVVVEEVLGVVVEGVALALLGKLVVRQLFLDQAAIRQLPFVDAFADIVGAVL